MKEFYINHVHFWVGNGKEELKLDRSINAVNDYARFAFGSEDVTELQKSMVRTAMTIFAIEKAHSNNWRRRHGLKMIRRNRKLSRTE